MWITYLLAHIVVTVELTWSLYKKKYVCFFFMQLSCNLTLVLNINLNLELKRRLQTSVWNLLFK